ncbi:MAG TPA: hypothetical protein VM733_07755, partial [Thermoanaerobaculia bacterium]|nr:hypothetical protein [Thermoanaerobaculia bacterium]
AVYVKSTDPPHTVSLVVPVLAVSGTPASELKEITKDCPSENRCFSLDGTNLTLNGTAGGSTFLDKTFLEHVPHLSRMTQSPNANGSQHVSPVIVVGASHHAVSGYLKYAGGKLSVDTTWCTEVKFEPQLTTPDKMCVAHHIIYKSGSPDGDFVELRFPNSKVAITIASTATVRVENLPTVDPTKPHFHHHADILNNVKVVATMMRTGGSCKGVPDGGKDCEPGVPGPRASSHLHAAAVTAQAKPFGTDYECTGSQFP